MKAKAFALAFSFRWRGSRVEGRQVTEGGSTPIACWRSTGLENWLSIWQRLGPISRIRRQTGAPVPDSAR